MLFANDCDLNAGSEQEMQHNMDKFSSACDAFGSPSIQRKQNSYTNQHPPKEYAELILFYFGDLILIFHCVRNSLLCLQLFCENTLLFINFALKHVGY